MTSFMELLRQWNKTNSERTKLQHAYIVLAVVILVAAGLLGLLNYQLGQSLLIAALIFAGLFLANAVAWPLLEAFVLSRLSRRTSTKSPSKK